MTKYNVFMAYSSDGVATGEDNHLTPSAPACGGALGLTAECARQIEAGALNKLRGALDAAVI